MSNLQVKKRLSKRKEKQFGKIFSHYFIYFDLLLLIKVDN